MSNRHMYQFPTCSIYHICQLPVNWKWRTTTTHGRDNPSVVCKYQVTYFSFSICTSYICRQKFSCGKRTTKGHCWGVTYCDIHYPVKVFAECTSTQQKFFMQPFMSCILFRKSKINGFNLKNTICEVWLL